MVISGGDTHRNLRYGPSPPGFHLVGPTHSEIFGPPFCVALSGGLFVPEVKNKYGCAQLFTTESAGTFILRVELLPRKILTQ